jgi:hypothetical protein
MLVAIRLVERAPGHQSNEIVLGNFAPPVCA